MKKLDHTLTQVKPAKRYAKVGSRLKYTNQHTISPSCAPSIKIERHGLYTWTGCTVTGLNLWSSVDQCCTFSASSSLKKKKISTCVSYIGKSLADFFFPKWFVSWLYYKNFGKIWIVVSSCRPVHHLLTKWTVIRPPVVTIISGVQSRAGHAASPQSIIG